MSPENDRPPSFIQEHGPRLRQFTDSILAQLDNAVDIMNLPEEEENAGQLWMPMNADNLYESKWPISMNSLPLDLRMRLGKFSNDEDVMVYTRYLYGSHQAQMVIWFSNIEGKFRTYCVIQHIHPTTGVLIDSPGNRTLEGYRNEADPEGFRYLMNTIFATNPEYIKKRDSLALSDAYKRGIITQAELGAEQLTVEKAEKAFGLFKLEVFSLNRTHFNNVPSETHIDVRLPFKSLELSEEYPYRGMLKKSLVVTQDSKDKVIDITRSSSVHFLDEPIVMNVNGRAQVTATGNLFIPSELNDEMREKYLYPNATPTLKDIEYFAHLVIEPLIKEDVSIAPYTP